MILVCIYFYVVFTHVCFLIPSDVLWGLGTSRKMIHKMMQTAPGIIEIRPLWCDKTNVDIWVKSGVGKVNENLRDVFLPGVMFGACLRGVPVNSIHFALD